MRKINLRGITESLSEREMKMVKGGLDSLTVDGDPGLTVFGCDGPSGCKGDKDCQSSQKCITCYKDGSTHCA